MLGMTPLSEAIANVKSTFVAEDTVLPPDVCATGTKFRAEYTLSEVSVTSSMLAQHRIPYALRTSS